MSASVGRDVFKESLHTRDEAEAITLFTIRHAQSLAEWKKHRTKLTAQSSKLTHKECIALAGKMRDLLITLFDDDPGDRVRWSRLMADDVRARLGLTQEEMCDLLTQNQLPASSAIAFEAKGAGVG